MFPSAIYGCCTFGGAGCSSSDLFTWMHEYTTSVAHTCGFFCCAATKYPASRAAGGAVCSTCASRCHELHKQMCLFCNRQLLVALENCAMYCH
jgi:hypothetical protein